MGEPARDASGTSASKAGVSPAGEEGGKSMEDILASIRNIIAKENKDAEPKASSTSPVVDPPVTVDRREPNPPENRASQPKAATPSQTPGGLAALAEKMRLDRLGRDNESQAPAQAKTAAVPSTPSSDAIVSASDENASSIDTYVGQHKPASPPPLEAAVEPSKRSSMSLKEIAELAKTDTSKAPVQSADSVQASIEPIAGKSGKVESAKSDQVATMSAPISASVSAPLETKSVEPPLTQAPQSGQTSLEKTTNVAVGNGEAETADSPASFRDALVSPATQQAVSGSMQRLKKRVEDIDSAEVEAVLRPLLKEWLDANLPAMVERMVSEEIKVIARRD